MKKFLILQLLIFVSVFAVAQINRTTISGDRDSILKKYILHRDTMTRNTWLNIMQANRYLEQLIHYDSLLIGKEGSNTLADSLEKVYIHKLQEAKSELKNLGQVNSQLSHDLGFYRKMFYMVIVLSVVFLILIIILIVLTGRLNRSLKNKDRKVKEYYTETHKAQEEVENSRKTENQLASEINKMKKQFSDELETREAEIQNLSEEKLMLENQIVEVRKAYELEANKRMELETTTENSAAEANEELVNELSERLEQVQTDYNVLKDNSEKLQQELHETETLKEEIKSLKHELEKQADARELAEQRFSELIEKIKNISNDF